MPADDTGAQAAADALGRGGIVVVPTDTVYGLAARPEEGEAVQMIYRIKRPTRTGLHLPVLAAALDDVRGTWGSR